MDRRGAIALGLLVAACGASPSTHEGGPQPDAGAGRDGEGADALACVGTDVFCGGVCQQESVAACGPSCTVCAQPATSHGMSDCFQNMCTFQCEGGYARCGHESCCGGQTDGDVAQLAVGGDTTCALTKSGAVSCWGSGAYGALGDGSVNDLSVSPVPSSQLVAGITQIVLGDHHGCALDSGGAVSCWGDDLQGQLGDGQRNPRGTVAPSQSPAKMANLTAGALHTCALSTGGGVWCWGDNTYGQLGSMNTASSSVVPVAVTGLASGVTSIAAGTSFTCAVMQDGSVKCWGDGAFGQLGTMMGSPTPVSVPLPTTVTAIAAGAHHVCAVTSAGTVLCWGAAAANQLGSAAGNASSSPLAVPSLAGIKSVSAGGDETCALDGGGAVMCWGTDPVGDDAKAPAGPGVVPSLTSGIASIATHDGHACAVTTGGAPKCWGKNTTGELGDGTMTASWVPIDVPGV